jgi:hypothetical protein
MARDHTNDWKWLACTPGNIETFCHRVAVLLRSHDTLNHICITDGINLRDRNRAFAPCALWGPICPPLGPGPPPPRALGAPGPWPRRWAPARPAAWRIGRRKICMTEGNLVYVRDFLPTASSTREHHGTPKKISRHAGARWARGDQLFFFPTRPHQSARFWPGGPKWPKKGPK